MKRISDTILAACVLVGIVGMASAIPQLINYQGFLTDDGGEPVRDGNYNLTFRIYDAETEGSELWAEAQLVGVEDGLFNVTLGSNIPIDLPFDTDYWLGVQIWTEPEIPRMRLTSVGYSFRAGRADTAEYALSGSAIPDDDWATSGDNIYRLAGRVGIGTANPGAPLHVEDSGSGVTTARFEGSYGSVWLEPSWSTTENRIVTLNSTGTATRDLWISGLSSQNLLTVKASGKVGIGTTSPDTTLHVVGNIKMVDGNQAAGRVLTSDAGGVGSWQPAPAGGTDWAVFDSVLYTVNCWGIAKGGAENMLYGDSTHTHVNLGVACTTGESGQTKWHCTISGGYQNIAKLNFPTVGGGRNNRATDAYTTVAGGAWNSCSGWGAVVCGGLYNAATNDYAIVGGGQHNAATGPEYATVSGGEGNTASGPHSTIGGGHENTAGALYATVGGGWLNTASEEYATIAGGVWNNAERRATVGGGGTNTASGDWATIAGGRQGFATDSNTVIGGGWANEATRSCATVAGGRGNIAGGRYSTVAGGRRNVTSGQYSAVSGGYADTVSGHYSSAAGCSVIVASGADYTFAFGRDFTTSSPNAVIFHNSIDPIKAGVGTPSPTATLDVNGSNGYNQIRMRTSYTPTDSLDSNGDVGDIAWDDDYIYIKTNDGWKRTSLSTF